MAEIIVKDLNFSYDKKTPVLEDVSFQVRAGEYVAIIGHNGSGKSTLAKLLMGLLEKDSGTIDIKGTLLTEENIYDLRSRLAIVFQNPDNQFIGATVRDDIAFGLENKQVDPAEMDAIINHYAQSVGMLDYLDHEPTKLSGGQKQRVAIAGALAMGPDLLIMDEATSMLDPKGRKEVNDLVHELHYGDHKTILSITHDIEEVLLSDYVIVMHQGKIALEGKPQEIFKHYELLYDLALDIPFSAKFNLALRDCGIEVDHPFDMEGMIDALWQLNSKI